ncbi:MAG: VWA domain-containing protein, partial [Gemmataceae bacterium]|nr:VWA domain-containing protein [Gemmataceae bacterium]
MIERRRLFAAGALLAIAGILACTNAWSDPGGEAKEKAAKDKELKAWREGDHGVIRPVVNDAAGNGLDIDKNSFTGVPLSVYKHGDGDTYFALQLQPKLADEPARPTDYLVIIDTSASKAMGYLSAAVHITKELASRLGKDDRIAIWTANLKAKDLTQGFVEGDSDKAKAALKDLEDETPLGAVDLKKALRESIASVEAKASRRRALIYLGDGKSVADPVDAAERTEIAQSLIKKAMPFHAVPLGPRIDSKNLHGLVQATGGKVIRTGLTEKAEVFLPRLLKDVGEPVLYGAALALPASATDVLPSRVPPLRRDVPTLVVGKLADGAKKLAYTVSGEQGGKAFKAESEVAVPAADPDLFFLHGMAAQWKAKPQEPALLAADRALGYAHKQSRIALDEVLSQGEQALEKGKIDAARKLFDKALAFAPLDRRPKAGLKLADEMSAGKKTRQELLEEVRSLRARREIETIVDGKRVIKVLADGDDKEPKEDKEPVADPLEDVRRRRIIAKQMAEQFVKEAVEQSARLVRTSPEEAKDILKRARAGLEGNPDLNPRDVDALRARLERGLESAERVGRTVARDQAQAAALRAAADARLDVRRTEVLAQDRVRERIRVFHNLMDQARELEAMKQADAIRKDLINEGLPIPVAVSAAYRVGQSSFYLREVREMRRVREQKFLEVLHEVERSHVPFPDEPPIEFPSAETIKKITRGRFDNWSDFSKFRINRYSQASFGSDVPGRFVELRELLKETIDFKGTEDAATTLNEFLNDHINRNETDGKRKFRGISWSFNDKAFKKAYGDASKDIRTEAVGKIEAQRTSLGGLLKRVLAKITVGGGGATYLIRRDQVEITTEEAQVKEKALRVYPVADLVFPTLNAYNPNQVGQTATLLGSLGQQGLAGGGLALGGGGFALGAGGLAGGL